MDPQAHQSKTTNIASIHQWTANSIKYIAVNFTTLYVLSLKELF